MTPRAASGARPGLARKRTCWQAVAPYAPVRAASMSTRRSSGEPNMCALAPDNAVKFVFDGHSSCKSAVGKRFANSSSVGDLGLHRDKRLYCSATVLATIGRELRARDSSIIRVSNQLKCGTNDERRSKCD